jgi:tetratricopeptide (TPR) repeat protein
MAKVIWGFCLTLLLISQQVLSSPLNNEMRESPREIGDLLVYALQTGEFKALDERFDKNAFVDKTMKIMNPDKENASLIRNKILEIISLEMVFKNALSGVQRESLTAKTLRVIHKDTGPVAIVRVNFEDAGSNYYELSLYKKKGQYFINDIFIIANAQFMSESIAQTMALIFNQSGGLLSRLKITNSDMQSINAILTEAMEQKRSSDFAAAYKTMRKLPEYIIENDVIHLTIVLLASNVDDKTYRDELSAFAKRHGNNPRYTFMLVDHFVFMEDYDQALKNIDALQLRYVKDASLLTTKAGVYLLKKDYKNAQATLKAAVDYEPDFEDAYWNGVTAALGNKEYETAADWLRKYESQFSFEFSEDNFQEQEVYKDFIKSKVFKKWMKSKKA